MSNSNTKMLIDATHPEETRVVVQRNGRVEEFDFESAARKLLRGNIYLAKVTRVEPSLQAAFVDYGGNRHGFLAFNEIHPDYYQIPVADRQALIDEEAAAEAELEAAADRRAEALARRSNFNRPTENAVSRDEHGDITGDDDIGLDTPVGEISHIVDVEEDEHIEEVGGDAIIDAPQTMAARSALDERVVEQVDDRATPLDADPIPEPDFGADRSDTNDIAPNEHGHDDDGHDQLDDVAPMANDASSDDDDDHDEEELDGEIDDAPVHQHEAHGSMGDDAPSAEYQEEQPQRQRRRQRSYKIQEVIKRRQVILVQVVKEERGNKGAALTTYLSLAGRYTVLMPNTARGGGISRKITNPQDRKRLKAIAQELEVPEGMGLIIRTAGAARTKQEIKRDFEYLLRLWESVRDLTLQSTAPSLVYEEGDLIKRSIRDLYNKDVEEVVVAGGAGYQEAADFMQMLMPSHAKNVIDYRDPTPLFTRYGVERQLNAMFLPQVTLRSGGYIVINQTEALVAIDVNSGKSTREFSIEETALATNLEAADEIARQLKLRDLAGLIVIDFIDMEEKRNNRSVERRLKDALRFDRARIQLGRISHFGLMEMSRQRLRTGVLEGSTSQCPHCQGTGIIRSTESIALAVLRGLEDTITAGATAPLVATTTPTVALYILNSKRAYITEMELRHGYSVTIVGSDRVQGANFTIERGAASLPIARRPDRAAVNMNWGFEGEVEGEDEAPAYSASNIEMVEDVDDSDEPMDARGGTPSNGEDDGSRRGRRRRRGRGRGGRNEGGDNARRPDNRSNDRPNDRADSRGDNRGERNGTNGPNDGSQPRFAVGDDQRHLDDSGEQPFISDDVDGDGDEHVAVGIEGTGSEKGARAEGDAERTGRRRRRGRRGGRRGRDRDGVEGARNGADGSNDDSALAPSEFENGTEADGTVAVDVAAVDGRDQRHVDQSRTGQSQLGQSRPDQARNGKPTGRSAQDARRSPRIWDAPHATETFVDADMSPLEGTTRTNETTVSVVHDVATSVTSTPDLVASQHKPHTAKPVAVQNVDAQAGATPVALPMEPRASEANSTPPSVMTKRHELGSSEPRVERVVVTPDQPSAADGENVAAPQRKGWWQRRFGGE